MNLSAILQKHRKGQYELAESHQNRLKKARTVQYQGQSSAASAGSQGGVVSAVQQGLSNLAGDVRARSDAERRLQQEQEKLAQEKLSAERDLGYESADEQHEVSFTQGLKYLVLSEQDGDKFADQAGDLAMNMLKSLEGRSDAERKLVDGWADRKIEEAKFDFAKKQYKIRQNEIKAGQLLLVQDRLDALSSSAYDGNTDAVLSLGEQLQAQTANLLKAGMLTAEQAKSQYANIEKTLVENTFNGEFDRAFADSPSAAMKLIDDLRADQGISANIRGDIAGGLRKRLSAKLKDADLLSKKTTTAAKQALTLQQGSVYAKTIMSINKNEDIDQAHLDQLLVDREISETHYTKLSNSLSGDAGEDPKVWVDLMGEAYSDDTEIEEVREDIYTAFLDGKISERNMEKAIGILEKREALEAKADKAADKTANKVALNRARYWRNYLKGQLSGERSPFGTLYKAKDIRRESDALLEFEQRLEGGESPDEFVPKMLETYRAGDASKPWLSVDSAYLNSTGGDVELAVQKLKEDAESGGLDSEGFQREMSKIEQYESSQNE